MAKSTSLQQVNVRLDSELKRQAEEVLTFMGSSATELIRCAYQKVARGAADYIDAMNTLAPKSDELKTAHEYNLVQAGWEIANNFYRSVGIEPASLQVESRSWDEIYEEAMTEHFMEKGVIRCE